MDTNKTITTSIRSICKSLIKYRIFWFTTLLLTSSLTLAWIVFAETYNTYLGTFDGVDVYSNGYPKFVSKVSTFIGNVRIGMKWQCVEYVNRYYYLKYGMDLRSRHAGNANTFWDAASQMGLDRFSNNSPTIPQTGDILVSTSGEYGHVAIVRNIVGTQVHIAQQNFSENSNDVDRILTLTISNGNYTVSAFDSSLPVRGWLRRKGGTQPPVCPAGSSENFRPNGYPPVHPNGTLLKLASDPTFYLIRDGQKQGISSQEVLEYLYSNGGFRFDDVITVSPEEFNSYPTIGEAITSELPSNNKTKADGTLIRKSSNGQISIVTDNGNRRPFDTYQTYTNLGYKDCNFIDVTDDEYNSYPAENSVDAMPKLTASMRLYNIGNVGQQIRGEFTITNVGTSAFTFNKLEIGGRLNNSVIVDFPFVSSVTLGPGQSYNYSQYFTPNSAGSYRFFVAYQEPNGHWATTVPVYNGAINSEVITINNSSTACSAPSTIGFGQTVNGTLQSGDCQTSGKYYDAYAFNGVAQQLISIKLNSTQFDSYLYLYKGNYPGGTLLNSDDDGGGYPNSRIPAKLGFVKLPTTGTYTIVASSYAVGKTGNYTLLLDTGFTISGTPNNKTNPSDFDSDGKADYSVFRPSDGIWYFQSSSKDGFDAAQFGTSTDKIAPADYDGDGRTDVAVFRDGIWYLLRSSDGFASVQFGSPGDIPVPGDFDGDGKSEVAVYRPSNGVWYVLNLANNAFNAVQFGISTDKPVVADYDGDGKSDYAVYRPSNGVWYILRSSEGFAAVQFGNSTDKPVVGDYDGDGRADEAVYRPSSGVWYLLKSSQGFASAQFGISTDLPVPGDYDGDGKADVAVWRPSNGTFYVLQSQAGFTATAFGQNGDVPIASAFVP